jgi:translocation and assembly module TamB
VDVRFEGTWDQASVPDLSALTGQVFLNEAEISFAALPEPLTDVDGRIQLSPQNIVVESFTGQFSEGQVTALGTLPTLVPLPTAETDEDAAGDVGANLGSLDFDPSTLSTQPLTVALDGIDLNLRGLYAGQVGWAVKSRGEFTCLWPPLDW